MADIIEYNLGGTPQNVTAHRKSVNTPDFSSKSNVLVEPDLTAVKGLDRRFWKVVGTVVEAMTTAEQKTITDAEQAVKDAKTALVASIRTKFKAISLTDEEVDSLLRL